MATTHPAAHALIINAATKNELTLVKQGGFYQLNGDVVVGDLYRDAKDMHVSVLLVSRKVKLEDLNTLEIPQETKSIEKP